ncbi:MAG: hypothetical protein A2010_15970 [Nitrospirae bacterium GWD2_57_9]|nr:MAG: hypothetical protein A2010_15970 [Nitrospirae bacterium GWD2_57_9]OGW45395.1 MAG: hypothetical protein A2078_00040 [Nitrospirae bacterium GWC2_57_9]
MLHLCSLLLLNALLFSPILSFAATGILEVHSEPPGALISIDEIEAGITPYQNLDAPAGKHRIKAFLSPEYPPQIKEVIIDERSPNVILFKFTERSRGTFVGKEIVSTTMKYRGGVTFASIPTGALVVINGEPIKKPAPIGYADVEVGKYQVEFLLNGRTLQAAFEVVQGETVKLVADFTAGIVINRWEQAKLQREAVKQQAQAPKAENQGTAKRQEAEMVQKTGLPPVIQPPAGSQPEPVVGAPPYGELMITMNARRDPDVRYSDFFDILSPKLPLESLSGPLFPLESSGVNSRAKDNFEYVRDDSDDTRKFFARVGFSCRDKIATESSARSSMMTVLEGKYDLKITRRRLVDNYSSMQKLLDETAREPIEIVRGQRLIVQITSHFGAENKMRYEIKRTYEVLGKKKSRASETSASASASTSDSTSVQLWPGMQN